MGRVELTRTNQACDLGIEVNENLDWSAHVSKITSKANRCLWATIRALGYSAPVNAKKLSIHGKTYPRVWSNCVEYQIQGPNGNT